jgi:hypothetical protein
MATGRAEQAGGEPLQPVPQPLGTAMYCLPLTRSVTGLLWMPLPVRNCHSSAPVRAR